MSKKKAMPTVKPPTVITITLPDEGSLPRTGQILVQRGTLAIIRQFSYSSLSEISTAIQQAAANLIQLEQNPPDIKPASEGTPPSDPADGVQESDEAECITSPEVRRERYQGHVRGKTCRR